MAERHIAIIGAGAWGIALACAEGLAGRRVTLWMRSPVAGTVRSLPRLPQISLPDNVSVTGTFPLDADLTLLTVPLQTLRSVAARLPGTSPLVACCKGVENVTGALPLDILAETQPHRSHAMLSGPNFAIEIAGGLPAAATLAAARLDDARRYAALLSTPTLRLYASDDPLGVQIAGAAKNVVAIAAGIAIGAGLGENARAALITRSIVEIGRLTEALGGKAATIAGLSGLGDLILTCTGAGSRNYSLGIALGQGETLDTILRSRTTVAEGVATAPALLALARRHGVDMPVTNVVARFLDGGIDLARARELLLERPPTVE
ncbi:NAD(P)H-dependent glycerol-3-phosphate dehydrogenase [Brytella acorum]|uniref:Glycerol-3-phosphate dehydrogenase [NAD(P)+] n=1 Tax=Brytella acorum TaxID=2959299 RepID=A0AA35UGZ6_9PROT|nr:NAD(P)H-dependent glycerol-3-phosphate dehydrogenase [Brytella acorum]MDF3624301.1 NAD(P)H-dependent glycerol-3-phosphate dehydrogenase [Brytella acorum]CAI9121125.1 NAD(P)H-dependent glycerol-3-phosphate dehydrogenase [Brytella acorum]